MSYDGAWSGAAARELGPRGTAQPRGFLTIEELEAIDREAAFWRSKGEGAIRAEMERRCQVRIACGRRRRQ